jgi:hypothetical protein
LAQSILTLILASGPTSTLVVFSFTQPAIDVMFAVKLRVPLLKTSK